MKKILLIIQREYLVRVRKKSFIITTLLFPLLYVGLIFGTAYMSEKGTTRLKIAVVDSSGKFTQTRIDKENAMDNSSTLVLLNENVDSLNKHFEDKGFDGYVVIPSNTVIENRPDQIVIKSNRTLGLVSGVQTKLNNIWNEIKYEELGIDMEKRQLLNDSKLSVQAENMQDKGANADIAAVIGYVSGFLIYFILIIYGSQIMMGVMEEKTGRIAEIMVSSVKPFQMMMGKIIGIALVALTQFFLWIAFIFIIYNATKSGSVAGNSNVSQLVGGVQTVFTSVNVPLVVGMFAFYFLGGFFFYASLYAAIGSAVNEDMREAQSLSFPVTMIVIFAIFILMVAMKDPTGPLAVWGSIIPFTSPIVMMARIPYGVPGTVPYWQLGLSIVLLIATFILTAWFAGKIYRTGILMYGKKPTWKEMIKWALRK
ncbi:MAG TPA: ABC transporter permease [Niabella sp.]|jgi:ABC-2 type transport system permease protein|nr:ABC transporter permease [Chitinophagaceae bacterium]HRN47885.1 ABC transporter permease [Niabella sp.]HUN01751.1 ABC transporter permease [Niabella sp.]